MRVASSSLSDEDKAIVRRALASPPWQPREAVRRIALQANCDGAIIVTKDLRVLGFGAKIVAPGEGVTDLYRLDPIPGPQGLYSCSLEEFGGTRHQSAVKFVAANKDTVAIVISQDRRMSVLHWSNDHNCVMTVQHAEWWI